MGKIKERFISILHIVIGEEEETLDEDGNINMDAFKYEDPKIMAELNKTSGNVDKTVKNMFLERPELRKETLRKMRASLDEKNRTSKGLENNSSPKGLEKKESEDLEK